MFLISIFPRPRRAVGVRVQTKGQEESKSRAEAISGGRYAKNEDRNDILSTFSNVEKKFQIFPFSSR